MKKIFSLLAAFIFMSTTTEYAQAQCTPVGDPSVFGDHVWNQYVWNSTNWTDNYVGYDVFTDLNYRSTAKWPTSGKPTTSTTYHGCALPGNDNFSWSCKRKGFDSGTYTINILQDDDLSQLYVNGNLVWSAPGCCQTYFSVWTGELKSTSTVEFRVQENTGFAVGEIEITVPCVPPGNPAVFGDHVWNQYVWNSYNWSDNYFGFDVDTNLLYQSTHLWTTPYDPTYSSTYSGCPRLYGAYSWSAKRKGFPAGNYSLDAGYTNGITLYVHGVQVFIHGGGGSTAAAWTGWLDDTSSVEVRSSSGYDVPYLALSIPQGNPNEWGDHVWNQYAFNYLAPPVLYAGYDVDTNQNYNSEHLWNRSKTPWTSSTYQGCYVQPEDFSFEVKRKGFDSGYYSISLGGNAHAILVNGASRLYSGIYPYFTGILNDTSTVDVPVYSTPGDLYGSIILHKAVGDPSIFGDHVWNEYIWNKANWTSNNYAGHDVDTNFSYATTHLSNGYFFPQYSPTYYGALYKPDEAYSLSAKRKGFPEGYYNITINAGSGAELWINGAMVWQQQSGTLPQYNVWTGCLNDSSKIEFKSAEWGGTLTISKVTSFPVSTNGPSTICPGLSEIFTAPSIAISYLWSTGDTTQSITVDSAGTYTVDLGCGVSTSQSLSIAPLPKPIYHSYGSMIAYPCNDPNSRPELIMENQNQFYYMIWNNEDTSHDWHFVLHETGDYFVRGVGAFGCTSEMSDTITYELLANGDTSVFGDHQWNVYAFSDTADGYWVGNQNDYYSDYYYVNPTRNYYAGFLVDTNLNFHSQDHWYLASPPSSSAGYAGCPTSNTHFHIFAKREGFECGLYQVNIPYHDDAAYLYVNGALVWSEMGINDSINNVWTGVLNENSKIEFRVYQDTDNNVASIDVIPLQLFTPATTISGPSSVCGTNSITLDAGAGFSSYLWSNGSITQTTSVNAAGDYSVTVTDANGCVATAQTTITTAAQNIYYADADGDSYGNNAVTSVSCTQPSGYVTNNTDCNDTKSTVHPNANDICNGIDDNCNGTIDENLISASVSPGVTAAFCPGGNVELTANSGTGISYQWQKNSKNIGGATNKTYVTAAVGDYRVKETNSFSCATTSAATTVSKATVPTATITALGNLNICAAGSVTLQANSGTGYTYQWKNGGSNIYGATQRNYTATSKATYTVIVSNNAGCSKESKGVKVTKSCKTDSGDEAVNAAELSIFPNPSDGNFAVSLYLEDEPDQSATIQIFNTMGQMVDQQVISIQNGNLNEEIHLANSASGTYIIRVIVSNQLYTSRIIIGQ